MIKKYNKINIGGVAITLISLGLGLGCGGGHKDKKDNGKIVKPIPKSDVEPKVIDDDVVSDVVSEDNKSGDVNVVDDKHTEPLTPITPDDDAIMTNKGLIEQIKTDLGNDKAEEQDNDPESNFVLIILQEKLATLPELDKYQSKSLRQAIPLLKKVVEKFVDYSDACPIENDLTQDLEKLRELSRLEMKKLGVLPDTYKNIEVSEHLTIVRNKEEAAAVALNVLTQVLTKAHMEGDYKLLKQRNAKLLPEYLDVVLNSYREECGWFTTCHFNKHRVAYMVGTVVVVTIGVIVWYKMKKAEKAKEPVLELYIQKAIQEQKDKPKISSEEQEFLRDNTTQSLADDEKFWIKELKNCNQLLLKTTTDQKYQEILKLRDIQQRGTVNTQRRIFVYIRTLLELGIAPHLLPPDQLQKYETYRLLPPDQLQKYETYCAAHIRE